MPGNYRPSTKDSHYDLAEVKQKTATLTLADLFDHSDLLLNLKLKKTVFFRKYLISRLSHALLLLYPERFY